MLEILLTGIFGVFENKRRDIIQEFETPYCLHSVTLASSNHLIKEIITVYMIIVDISHLNPVLRLIFLF